MSAAPIPADEKERLQSLKSLNILETAMEERFERVTRLASRLLDVPMSAISFIDGGRQWFKSIQGLNATETPREHSFCAHAYLGDSLFEVPDATEDDRFWDNPLVTGDPSIRFYAGQPIKAPDGRTIGTLCVIDRKPRRLTSNQVEDLKDLAAMVEVELRSKQMAAAQIKMNEELAEAKKAVLVDPLTRLWNRAGAEEFLSRQHQLAVQNNEKFCLAMVDIDHFKKVNDTYGHPAGDEVLREVARRILRSIRTDDFACRMGGEEFLLIIADPNASDALQVAQRVREAIRSQPIVVDGTEISITISAGMAYFDPANSTTFDEVIRLADAGLYRAKQNGRDRIVSHIENCG
jgi:diguanylate cyclase (GGDEF)-like protein